jgi:hypothetical protein
VVYNNFQYRDKNFTVAKTPGVVRIGVMGDSNAFGYGIKNVNNRFSNILEHELNTHGYHTEVYNFGVPGLDTETEIHEYQRIKQLNFDILVWEYFLNDIEISSESAGQKVLQTAQIAPSGLITFLSDHSFFFDYIYWRLNAKYDKTFVKIRNADLAQYDNPRIFNYHTHLINSFTQDLKSNGKKIVTLVLPFLYFFPNYPANAISIHHRMDKLFLEDGVAQVVDMLDYVKGKHKQDLVVGPYDAHPNEYVHKIAADKLYDAIIPLLEKTPDGKTIIKQ